MSSPVNAGAQLHGISLQHNFQQSPVGSLGGRSVQQAPAQAPRSLGTVLSDIGRGIQSLASRVLNAVTPHGVRTEAKFRAGLEATSAHMGQLLGAISHASTHQADGAAAQKLLGGLRDVAAPVTSRGASLDTVVRERTTAALRQMTPDQREALHKGLAMAENSALKGDPVLAAMRSAMEQHAIDQGMDRLQGDLDLAIAMTAKEAQDTGITGRAFQQVYDTAREVLRDQGFGHLPDKEFKEMQRALVLQAVEARVGDGDPAEVVPMAQVINLLPSKELHALMHITAQIGPEDPTAARFVVSGAIGVRAEKLEKAVADGTAALLARRLPAEDDPAGMLHAPQAVARDIAATGSALAELRAHCDIHGMHFPAALEAPVAQLQGHLQAYLNPLNLSQLPELSAGQLHSLGQGLQGLGVQTGQPEIAADAARRRSEAMDAGAQAMQPALQALAQGDTAGLLRGLGSAQPPANAALDTHIRLGMKVEGADEVMAFREQLVGQAIQHLDTPALQALSARLGSPAAEALSDELSSAAMPLLGGSHAMEAYDSGLGRQMFDRATDLGMLKHCVDQRLGALGAAVPAPAWDGALPAADVVRDVFSAVRVGDSAVVVRAGTGGPAVQGAVQDNLDAMLAAPGKDREHDVGGVSEGFVKDLTRATYTVADADGVVRPMIDKDNPDKAGSVRSAAAQLRELAGGNEALALKVSRLANQNVLAGVQQVLMSQQSPLRLPDGTPGRLMGPERIEYALSSDGDGGIVLQVNYAVEGADVFLPAPRNAHEGVGIPVELDAARSGGQFHFALHVGADLAVSVQEPVRFTYDTAAAGAAV